MAKLRFVGTTSQGGNCPTMYQLDDGRAVIQGPELTDADGLDELRDVLGGEKAVVVPRELITRFASEL